MASVLTVHSVSLMVNACGGGVREALRGGRKAEGGE